jgi:hypothetical protein
MSFRMRSFTLVFFLLSLWAPIAGGHQKLDEKEDFRPPITEIKQAVALLPKRYQKDVLAAIKKAGRNGWQFIYAIKEVNSHQREGLAFLIANMPGRDLVSLKKNFLIGNTSLAYQALREAPWGSQVPKDIFLNNVLPYASLNERRDKWRWDFYQRFMKIAKEAKTMDEAVITLNQYVFKVLNVTYHATKRPKPDQSPYESIEAHYASCTGLSILLTDALRAVGIPARIAGTPMWADESGNHTWVEIWDGQWHYIGAAEPTPLDQAWFTGKAAKADAKHPIYAVSFKKTSLKFPMRWAPYLKFVSAIDVSERYKRITH